MVMANKLLVCSWPCVTMQISINRRDAIVRGLVNEVFVDPCSVFRSSFLFSGDPWRGKLFCCNFIAIREDETQEEYRSNRGDYEPQIWLLYDQATRSISRVEGATREHESHNFELKDISKDQCASRRL